MLTSPTPMLKCFSGVLAAGIVALGFGVAPAAAVVPVTVSNTSAEGVPNLSWLFHDTSVVGGSYNSWEHHPDGGIVMDITVGTPNPPEWFQLKTVVFTNSLGFDVDISAFSSFDLLFEIESIDEGGTVIAWPFIQTERADGSWDWNHPADPTWPGEQTTGGSYVTTIAVDRLANPADVAAFGIQFHSDQAAPINARVRVAPAPGAFVLNQIPEPASALLLLPALAFVSRRRRG